MLQEAESSLKDCFAEIDEIALCNQSKVLSAFRENKLSPEYFAERTGYGIDDAAREIIDKIFAQIVGAESAALRLQMVSGTHALACALFGNLSPGDELIVLTGQPYDTLERVIGIKEVETGSLRSLGVSYLQTDILPFLSNEEELLSRISQVIHANSKLAYIQKSCGYSLERQSLLNSEIATICRQLRRVNPELIIMVDNCYGEFVEKSEPLSCGADLIAGSMIKNPGGGLAISGGYFAGKARLVDNALNRLTAPGIGGHLGLSFNQNRLILQGLFLAPQVVANAVKGANLFGYVFSRLGFEVTPAAGTPRGDIIQAIKFGNRQKLQNFLKHLQRFSPVDSHVIPEAADMPGYADQVLMAGGTFVEGSTIELSADGPLREPFAAYVQGGLSYLHVKLAIRGLLEAASAEDAGFI